MEEFWLISAPGDPEPEDAYDTLARSLTKNDQPADDYIFSIPDLKVGTLDALIGLTDELNKLDTFAEMVAKKVAAYMAEILENQRDQLASNLSVDGKSMSQYICHFQWDTARFPVKQPLKNLSEIISKNVTQIENDLKAKSQAYSAVKTALQGIEMKTMGSLLLRNLADLVGENDFVLNSEYLITILVVIPVALYKDWKESYETLTDYVVPESSHLLSEDSEYGLWTVTLFRKVLDNFKHECARRKFFVRDFQYNTKAVDADRDELAKLDADKKKMLGPLLRWLKVSFGEVFSAWIHVKALRVFVESVLRYGLPVNFQAAVLHPKKKQQRKLREVLRKLYQDLDNTSLTNVKEEDQLVQTLSMATQDYYPYVYCRIILDFEK